MTINYDTCPICGEPRRANGCSYHTEGEVFGHLLEQSARLRDLLREADDELEAFDDTGPMGRDYERKARIRAALENTP